MYLKWIRQAKYSSLGTKAIYRIRQRRPDGLETYGSQCDQEGAKPGGNKNPPAHFRAVCKMFKPALKIIPGNRDSDQQGNEYKNQKFPA